MSENAGRQKIRWRELPRLVARWFRIRRAWDRHDWSRMAALLEPIVRERQSTEGDRITLAHAYTKQGRLEQAAWYFESIAGEEPWSRDETIAYCNSYAYVLARSGRLEEAKRHVRRFDRKRWPRADREWAEALLETGSTAEPPGRGTARRFH